MLVPIPCMLMRGGTSKGPFFLASDLPSNPADRDQWLLAIMGSPDARQIDGIGGGNSLTSKAVIVNPSTRPGIDVDYLFAQVSLTENTVDTGPNCGNMLSGVAPFAIERGLVKPGGPVTRVRIYNINTGKVMEAVVQTPAGHVTYEGDVAVDGVPGTGAGVQLNFLDAAGAKTGALLPTGRALDVVDGVPVTCIDFTTPMVLIAAASLGKTGHESKAELDADAALLERLEQVRLQAALLMGMGDVTGKVLPKVALLGAPQFGGGISSRYFVPWNCHAAHAATGATCVAAACCIPGTVAAPLAQLAPAAGDGTREVVIEHPAGKIAATVQPDGNGGVASAGIVRTARPLFNGQVYVRVPEGLRLAA
ncbi:4-oxalomesaconate tautomerase [Duganella sp. FT92W]|uniref:4-oxalomesaconate tautomerase n=1 Tax=Pseudoduganella rivuli TaxID=2666085 RepID=A0A7X2IML7_9BURK|nr:4-oxalomesaconate tautomerase [Pseudoduganella rivuli]MRV72626.1 4-oxalomesaconate tautomerase [Pseudoduganella rivuli]